MKIPLDTVEPTAWKRTRINDGAVEYFTERDWKHEFLFEWEPLYSGALLAEHRKQVLLEAAKYFEGRYFKEWRALGEEWTEDVLRRMAEGKK